MAELTTSRFLARAAELRPLVEQALDRYTHLGDGCPAPLAEAIRYSLLAPAKRLRPLLTLMAAEACGGTVEEALPAASAVEMIHTYSLIHDDLPAMDDDDLRRGRPTNHVVFGEGLAILAGDALLTLAFEVLARGLPAETAAVCCGELARAAGAVALVGGQADDLANGANADGRDDLPEALAASAASEESGTPTEERLARLESIHERKTGAMFLVALRLGARSAGAAEWQLDVLEQYGRRLGLLFQITDDLLDVEGSELAVGKRVGKDQDRGKLTFPGLLGIEESRRRAEQLAAEAVAALQPFGPAAEGLETLARYVVERDR